MHDITLDRVSVTLDRTTQYQGRPLRQPPDHGDGTRLRPHDTPGFSIEHADNVTLRDCKVAWGANAPEYFSYAVEAKDATGLKIEGLVGGAARAILGKAVSIS